MKNFDTLIIILVVVNAIAAILKKRKRMRQMKEEEEQENASTSPALESTADEKGALEEANSWYLSDEEAEDDDVMESDSNAPSGMKMAEINAEMAPMAAVEAPPETPPPMKGLSTSESFKAITSKPKRTKRFFQSRGDLKKAVIMSEILGKPRAENEV